MAGKRENAANYAPALVQPTLSQRSRQLISTLSAELNRAFSEAQVLVQQLEQGPRFAAPVEMRIYGLDLKRLRELGNQAQAQLA
ncbi:MAG TPA: hypothetical protein V6D16_05300 [Candidatus Obscuribacterales bacterium]